MNMNRRSFSRLGCYLFSYLDFDEVNDAGNNEDYCQKSRDIGLILNISESGAYLVSSSDVKTDMPVKIDFSARGKNYALQGKVIRVNSKKKRAPKKNPNYIFDCTCGTKYLAVEFDDIAHDIKHLSE